MDSENQSYLWFLIIIALLVFAGSVLIFGKDNLNGQEANVTNREKTSYPSRVYTVFYTSGVFSPTNLQINVGDTVRFVNDSLLPVRVVSDPHPEHTDLPGFDSISEVPLQGTFIFTFTQRGIFDYHNDRRPNQKGTIIVK